jgi:hypothetical protein
MEYVIEYFLFIFIFHICENFHKFIFWGHNMQNFNVYNHIVTFWKNWINFCVQWVPSTIFGEDSFVFRFS